jgi:catechol 2,3-dioxygenase-like lactoylglutathione lyase family enzyme
VAKDISSIAETAKPRVNGLVPMAHVADVQRSADFYKLLGMEMGGRLKNPAGRLQWAWLACQQAQLMVTQASETVVPQQQAVLFYLYSPDLVAVRDHLLAHGVKVSKISYPDYMPKGEIRVIDPDGYCLLIGQAG